MANASTASRGDDLGKLILRLTVAILMGFHGVSKLQHGVAWLAGPLRAHNLPTFVAYGVYLGEVVAPILLILGILTRPAALLIAIDMLMALYLVVDGHAFELQKQGGGLGAEVQFLYLFAAIAIALLGSGRFALSKGQGRWD